MDPKEKIKKLSADYEELVKKVETEKRDFTKEEMEKAESLMSEIEEARKQEMFGGKVQQFRKSLTGQPVEVTTDPKIGMSDKEVKQFSFIRAIRASAMGDWRIAPFEKECSDVVAKKLGKEARGFFVPYDVQTEKRASDAVKGTPGAGGLLIATDLMSQNFIELLRSKLAIMALGALPLSGLVGDVAIPRQSAGSTAYHVGEDGAITHSVYTVQQLALSPKTVGGLTDISRRLLAQSSIDCELFVKNDLAAVLALAMDAAAIKGGGSNEPTGILATSGIGDVAGGTNGAAPTWANIVELETDVSVANADIGKLSYLTNAKVRGKLKGTLITATYGDRMVWADGSTPLNGYPAFVSNQVPSNLVKNASGAVCSAIIFGNFADLIWATWGTLDILSDPYSVSNIGAVRIVAFYDYDIGIRHAASFSAMQDALTT